MSLINDLPLFVDPFLLFNSDREDFKQLHENIITYVKFLRDEANSSSLSRPRIEALFTFPEVKQNWLGFSLMGNNGRGLGWEFANALHRNLTTVFKDFGKELLTKDTHIEQLCLIKDGVGRDNISDFTVNLIKEFLCEYTQAFAHEHLDPSQYQKCAVEKAKFNYATESWMTKNYDLPYWRGDYVILTPKAMLTKDETWINRPDLIDKAQDIGQALPNQQLRAQVAHYFGRNLSFDSKVAEIRRVRAEAVEKFPELIQEYIAQREREGKDATRESEERVAEAVRFFVDRISRLAELLGSKTDFYSTKLDSLSECRKRIDFLKDVIENKDGYRIFYQNGVPIGRESDLQILFRLTWYATALDLNREVNNGRGPVDFAASFGSADKSLVEMKLARNSKLKQNLKSQLDVYKKSSSTDKGLTVILYFSEAELSRVKAILKEIERHDDDTIYLIDADATNKPSASNA